MSAIFRRTVIPFRCGNRTKFFATRPGWEWSVPHDCMSAQPPPCGRMSTRLPRIAAHWRRTLRSFPPRRQDPFAADGRTVSGSISSGELAPSGQNGPPEPVPQRKDLPVVAEPLATAPFVRARPLHILPEVPLQVGPAQLPEADRKQRVGAPPVTAEYSHRVPAKQRLQGRFPAVDANLESRVANAGHRPRPSFLASHFPAGLIHIFRSRLTNPLKRVGVGIGKSLAQLPLQIRH